MSWSQLSTLASAGQEIGGKTVDGTNLTTQSTAQQIAEICNDRQARQPSSTAPGDNAVNAEPTKTQTIQI
jgi:hypothetical protein